MCAFKYMHSFINLRITVKFINIRLKFCQETSPVVGVGVAHTFVYDIGDEDARVFQNANYGGNSRFERGELLDLCAMALD